MPFVDYVVTGEGHVAFMDLLVSSSDGGDPAGMPALCRPPWSKRSSRRRAVPSTD